MRSSLVLQSVSRARACITSPSRTLAVAARPTTRSFSSQAGQYSTQRRVSHQLRRVKSKEIISPYMFDSTTVTLSPLPIQYPREIVFLGGAPGAGKGTNSAHVANIRNYSAPTIVVSDLLNTPVCRALKDQGMLVDDAYVFNILLEELQKPIYRNGVVVDGFPRTAVQAELLTNFYKDLSEGDFLAPAPRMLFVMLTVNETVSIRRQQERAEKIILLNKDRQANGLSLFDVRATDLDSKASLARYEVFKQQYEAVLSLGKQFPLVVVDASKDVANVRVNLSVQLSDFS